MKQFKKVLIHKEYASPVFWGCDENPDGVKSYFELVIYFDFELGLRFRAGAPNVSYCNRNPFKAILRLLEHESIGMCKYDALKYRVRKQGLAQKL